MRSVNYTPPRPNPARSRKRLARPDAIRAFLFLAAAAAAAVVISTAALPAAAQTGLCVSATSMEDSKSTNRSLGWNARSGFARTGLAARGRRTLDMQSAPGLQAGGIDSNRLGNALHAHFPKPAAQIPQTDWLSPGEGAADVPLHLGSPLDEGALRWVDIRYADYDEWVSCATLTYVHDDRGRVESVIEQWGEGSGTVEYELRYRYAENGGLAGMEQIARMDGLSYTLFESDFAYDGEGRLTGFEEKEYDLSETVPYTTLQFAFTHSDDGRTSEGLAVRDGYDGTPDADTSFVQVLQGTPLVMTGYESALIPLGGTPYRYRNMWRETFPTLSTLNAFFLTYTLWYPFVPREYEYWDEGWEEWVPYDRIRYERDANAIWVRSEQWDRYEGMWIPWRDFVVHLDAEERPEVIDNIERYWGEPRWVERHLVNGAVGTDMEPETDEEGVGGGRRATGLGPSLLPNSPNPFNPVTTLRYRLPGAGRVRLEVFNLLGRRMMRIDEGMRPAGTHDVVLDASNLPGGVYICRIQSPAGSDTRRILLIK